MGIWILTYCWFYNPFYFFFLICDLPFFFFLSLQKAREGVQLNTWPLLPEPQALSTLAPSLSSQVPKLHWLTARRGCQCQKEGWILCEIRHLGAEVSSSLQEEMCLVSFWLVYVEGVGYFASDLSEPQHLPSRGMGNSLDRRG